LESQGSIQVTQLSFIESSEELLLVSLLAVSFVAGAMFVISFSVELPVVFWVFIESSVVVLLVSLFAVSFVAGAMFVVSFSVELPVVFWVVVSFYLV
jgi:hypothetical protein